MTDEDDDYSTTVYDKPEKFGLLQIASADWGGAWEFDMIVVWQHKTGRLYFGQDSGCSCPMPFEGVTALDDLTELTLDNYDRLWNIVRSKGITEGEKLLRAAHNALLAQQILPESVEFDVTIKVDVDVPESDIKEILLTVHVPAILEKIREMRNG